MTTKFDFEGQTIRIIEDAPEIPLGGRPCTADPGPCIFCEKVGPPNRVMIPVRDTQDQTKCHFLFLPVSVWEVIQRWQSQEYQDRKKS